jgi:hypothetical protein
MAKDPKKRQQKLQRKAAKRKQKRAQIARTSHRLTAPSLSRAGGWPLRAVWISKNWQDTQRLTQIVVARDAPTGHVAIGVFLVDLGSLGVKNAYGRVVDETEYELTMDDIESRDPLMPGDLDLAAKIVREAVDYAKGLGFRPNKDIGQALRVLGDANPDACTVTIPLGGEDGKPYYFGGPYDNYDRIIATLTKAVGPDGFTYVVPLGDDFDMLEDEDWDED